jgi:hypothetical protein
MSTKNMTKWMYAFKNNWYLHRLLIDEHSRPSSGEQLGAGVGLSGLGVNP